MRMAINYRSVFQYDSPVAESQNELRACPRSSEHQRVISYRVTTDPSARVSSHTDYWGTRVDSFGVRLPHTQLTVVAETVVETSQRPQITSAPNMADLSDIEFRRENVEWLEPTTLTAWDDDLRERAEQVVTTFGPDLIGVVLGMHRLVKSEVAYQPGTTDVATTAAEVWRQGIGVCQDQAHVAIALCRSVGIPARYVSGYLFEPDAIVETAGDGVDSIEVQTHAWFEARLPDGWMSLDPTNGQHASELHVEIGHGRDYADVTPIHGVHLGMAEVELESVVSMQRGVSLGSPSAPVAPTAAAPVGTMTLGEAGNGRLLGADQ